MELAFRKSEPGQTQYSPDCLQKVAWVNPDGSRKNQSDKKVAGAMALTRPTFTNSFLKNRAGLSIDRNVTIEEAELVSKGGGENGHLTVYFSDESLMKFDGFIFNMDWGDGFTQQEVGVDLEKDVVKRLLEQTQDVAVKVQGDWGSYEQVIPVEVIQEFSEFYTECLK
jgi:hypothetical protein